MVQSYSGILWNFLNELNRPVCSDMENFPRYIVKLKKKKKEGGPQKYCTMLPLAYENINT